MSLQVGRIVLQNRIADTASGRSSIGEDRRIAFGLINGRLFACVYTLRGETHRIISVRKAGKQEQRKWQFAR